MTSSPEKKGEKKKEKKIPSISFWWNFKSFTLVPLWLLFLLQIFKTTISYKKPKKTFKSILRLCIIATSFIRWGKFCLLIFHKFWKKNSISRPFWSKWNSKMIFFPKNSFQSILILYDTVTSLVFFAINFIRS